MRRTNVLDFASLLMVGLLLMTGCSFVLPSEKAMEAGFGGRTKDRFVATVDAICREADDRVGALGQPTGVEERLDVVKQSLEIRRDELDRVNGLKHPQGGEDGVRFQLVLTWLGNRVSALAATALELGLGNEAQADSYAARAKTATREVRSASENYGLDECGRT